MSKRFQLTRDIERPGRWALSDTENGVVVTFDAHKWNETHSVAFQDRKTAESMMAQKLAVIMREMGEYMARHHGGIAFDRVYGFEFDEDSTSDLYLCRYKKPRWRLKMEAPFNTNGDIEKFACSLRKASEYVVKGRYHDR